jgi:hypothetical protein
MALRPSVVSALDWSMGGGSAAAEVQYLVLPDGRNPYLLARVRWPDVAQAISAGRPDWQDDPGLFDLPYDPSSATVTLAQAASIAASWGANLHSDPADSATPLIRRMPANWSNLVPAEKRAWSLEFIAGRNASASHAGRFRSLLRTFDRSSRRPALEPDLQMAEFLGTPIGAAASEDGRYLVAEDNGRLVTVASERRRHARVHVYGRAEIRRGHRTISANLVNVSQGGVHCVVPDPQSALEFGAKLDPPLLLEEGVSQSRSVTWHREIGPGMQLGVGFAELSNDQVKRVQRFLVTVGSEPGS